jgi:hypothetical protein
MRDLFEQRCTSFTSRWRTTLEPRVLYQAIPSRLKLVFILGPLAIVLAVAIFLAAGDNGSLRTFSIAALAIIILVLAVDAVQIAGYRKPLLLITPETLIFRSISIEWNKIAGVRILNEGVNRCAGIVLPSGTGFIPASPGMRARVVAAIIDKGIARYGALPIPAVRGMTVDGLCELLKAELVERQSAPGV